MKLTKTDLLKSAETIWPMTKVFVQPISSIGWTQKVTAETLREIANHEDLERYEAQAMDPNDAAVAICERNQTIRELRVALQSCFDQYMGPHSCGDFTCSCGNPKVCGMCEARQNTSAMLDKTKLYAIGD